MISAQKIRVIDNKGTIKEINNNQVITQANAPTAVVEGDVWFNTTTNTTFIYDATNNWKRIESASHSGDEGSVFFAGANGFPTENNNHFFWNESATSLHIGQNAKNWTNKFNVSGTIRTQGVKNSNGTANVPAYRFTNDTDTGMYSSLSDQLSFSTSGFEAVTIDQNQNTGFSVNTPTEKVDINGKLRIRDVEQVNTLSPGDKIVIIDNTGVVKKITTNIHTIGDIKYSIQENDHNGWYILDGRNIATLPTNAQANASTFNLTVLPDATDRVLKHPNSSEGLLIQGGNATTTLTQNNIPNYNLPTATTTTDGDHAHTYQFGNVRLFNMNTNNGQPDRVFVTITPGANDSTNQAGAHNHQVTVNSGGSNEAFQQYQPYLTVNSFIYLGQ